MKKNEIIVTTIAPWLTVPDGPKAVEFYKAAFDAVERYRLQTPDGGLVIKLSVNGAEFWISSDNSKKGDNFTQQLGGGSVRMILTVNNPDTIFTQALSAGASQVFPISEGHGWKLGRLVDPFGLHWEVGHPLPK
jgi:PhnB protein